VKNFSTDVKQQLINNTAFSGH